MTRGEYGLMIDYEYCSGCHACEVACKKEHDMPKGDFGIRLVTMGPFETSDGKWEFNNIPVPTHLSRAREDREPGGVQTGTPGNTKRSFVLASRSAFDLWRA